MHKNMCQKKKAEQNAHDAKEQMRMIKTNQPQKKAEQNAHDAMENAHD